MIIEHEKLGTISLVRRSSTVKPFVCSFKNGAASQNMGCNKLHDVKKIEGYSVVDGKVSQFGDFCPECASKLFGWTECQERPLLDRLDKIVSAMSGGGLRVVDSEDLFS